MPKENYNEHAQSFTDMKLLVANYDSFNVLFQVNGIGIVETESSGLVRVCFTQS